MILNILYLQMKDVIRAHSGDLSGLEHFATDALLLHEKRLQHRDAVKAVIGHC